MLDPQKAVFDNSAHLDACRIKGPRWCGRALCWNSMWRNLRRHEVILSGGEVNWLIDGLCGERLPTIDLAHVDLTGGEQRPEQHGRGVCGRQHGLRLDPSLE